MTQKSTHCIFLITEQVIFRFKKTSKTLNLATSSCRKRRGWNARLGLGPRQCLLYLSPDISPPFYRRHLLSHPVSWTLLKRHERELWQPAGLIKEFKGRIFTLFRTDRNTGCFPALLFFNIWQTERKTDRQTVSLDEKWLSRSPS